LVCGSVIDISIAIFMSIILISARSRTKFHETRSRLGILIRLSIQTGSLTAFLAIVILVLFSVEDEIGLMQTLTAYMLGKLCAIFAC